MFKNPIVLAIVLVVGALLGSFLGEFIGIILPYGAVRELFTKDLTAGLSPFVLDLRILQITFGCIIKLNIMSIVGIVVSALILRKIGYENK